MSLSNKQVYAVLVVVVFAAYANALLWGVFQFDDYNVIVGNPAVHSWPAWWADVGHGIRPLLKLSYTFDWSLGWGASGFHLSNLLIHAGNTLLIWLLTAAFLRQSGRLAASVRLVSTTTALLFAVHPIHTEAVTYISGRSSSLMALCYLGGMLCFLAGRQRQSRLYLHVATPLLFVAALAVKEVALTFPLALALLHVASGGTWHTALARTWSSWLVFFASFVYLLLDASYSVHLLRSLAAHAGWSNLALQANALIYLLGQWWWPLGLNIDPDLRGAEAISSVKLGGVIAAMAGTALLLGRLRQHPWLGFALAWLLLQLLLVYLITPRIDIANERQLYLVSWPLLMALTAEMALWLTARQFIALSALLLVTCTTLTVLRNLDYRSELALWQATVVLSPDKARVHNNLGYAHDLAGQKDAARQHYLQALALERQNFKSSYNLKALDASQQ